MSLAKFFSKRLVPLKHKNKGRISMKYIYTKASTLIAMIIENLSVIKPMYEYTSLLCEGGINTELLYSKVVLSKVKLDIILEHELRFKRRDNISLSVLI